MPSLVVCPGPGAVVPLEVPAQRKGPPESVEPGGPFLGSVGQDHLIESIDFLTLAVIVEDSGALPALAEAAFWPSGEVM